MPDQPITEGTPTMIATDATGLQFIMHTDDPAFEGLFQVIHNSDISTQDLARMALIADRMPYLYRNTYANETHIAQGLISYNSVDSRRYYQSLADEGSYDQLRLEAVQVLVAHHFTLDDLTFTL